MTHLLVHACNGVRGLLRFQQVIRELKDIASDALGPLLFLRSRVDRRFKGGILRTTGTQARLV